MDPSLYERLSEGQKDCLRLKHRNFLIKEMASALGIHESSVNDRLHRARQILCAGSSVAAARMLAEHEQDQGTWIPPTGSKTTMAFAPSPAAEDAAQTGDGIADERLEDSITPIAPPASGLSAEAGVHWPFPTKGRQENDLNFVWRSAWVPACAAVSLIAFLLIAVLTIGLQQILGDVLERLLHHG